MNNLLGVLKEMSSLVNELTETLKLENNLTDSHIEGMEDDYSLILEELRNSVEYDIEHTKKMSARD